MRNIFFYFVLAMSASSFLYAANVININNAVAKANVSMSGKINAKHGKFFGNVLIASDEVTMSNSIIKGTLTIKSEEKIPVVVLLCGTQISGGITFNGKAGIIKKSADSVIDGKIVNGAIEKIKSPAKCN